MPESRLTWHKGSVLPYASRWHTIMHACALNALHPDDLPWHLPASTSTINSPSACEGGETAALARCLGESPDVFRWSTFAALPEALHRALVVPRPRLCFACLAAGYHSALFSVELFDACPIHGAPLVDQCHCGAPFSGELHSWSADGPAAGCRCDRLHFFTRETCRRPTLPTEQTCALDPVAQWLDAMSLLIRPAQLDRACCRHATGSVEWLIGASRALGIAYPACLRPVSDRQVPVSLVSHVPRFPGRRISAQEKSFACPGGARPLSATASVYRALARRIRRHLAPGSARTVARFITACDPLLIAEWVAASANVREAFVDLLWSRAIEPGVEKRRWPDRPLSTKATVQLTPSVEQNCQICSEALDDDAAEWLASHAARVSLGALWHDAQARTSAIAQSTIAAWADVTPRPVWSDSAWLARVMPRGVQFIAPVTASWLGPSHASKGLRRARYLTQQRTRFELMWNASRGACLTWSEMGGWYVIDALTPANRDVRHRRLLGLSGGRPWCWLYQGVDGQFVARWDNAPLQVCAATPAAAIAGLRRCATICPRIGDNALPYPDSAPVIRPSPMSTIVAADYRLFVDCVKARGGFWSEAGKLARTAGRYRRALAVADQTRRSHGIG
jgi:hypothetical protein